MQGCFGMLVLAIGVTCNATVANAQSYHVGGFVSQSALYSSDNTFLGRTDDNVSFDYSEAALIANLEMLPGLSISTQLLSRNAGVGDNGYVRFDYAFLNWRFWENANMTHSIIAGRLKAPIGFYNDLRDSPFTRNGEFLPQGLYIDRIRNTTMATDEVMYVGELRHDLWTYSGKLGVGRSLQDQDEINDLFNIPHYMQGRFVNHHAWHSQFLADYDAGRVRLAYSDYSAPLDFSAHVAMFNYELTGTTSVRFHIFSFEYNALNWSLTSEAYRAYLDYTKYQTGEYSDQPEGIYLQAVYKPTAQADYYVRYDYSVFDKDDRDGKAFFSGPQNFFQLPAFSRYARDITLGACYRPTPNWLLRLEYHSVQGTFWMTARDLAPGVHQSEYWDIVAFSASWRF